MAFFLVVRTKESPGWAPGDLFRCYPNKSWKSYVKDTYNRKRFIPVWFPLRRIKKAKRYVKPFWVSGIMTLRSLYALDNYKMGFCMSRRIRCK